MGGSACMVECCGIIRIEFRRGETRNCFVAETFAVYRAHVCMTFERLGLDCYRCDCEVLCEIASQ